MEEDRRWMEDALDFWGDLKPEEREELLRYSHAVCYPKGKTIHAGKEDCAGVILMKKGRFRTYMLSDQGREITLYRLYPADVCVLSASCVLEAITFEVFLEAEENTELILIPSSVFRGLAEKNVYVRCFGYELASRRFSEVLWSMQEILFKGIDKRLAGYLLKKADESKSSAVACTHEEIARDIGSAREVVSRMLKYFEAEGLVALSRGRIQILDRRNLEKTAR